MRGLTTNGVPELTPDEAAACIKDGDLVGFSGFSAAASPKAVPAAIARKAVAERAHGRDFKIRVLTGANGGPTIDDVLSEGDAVAWRCPYQNCKAARERINKRSIEYVDMHLSQVGQSIGAGFFGKLDWAVVEATELTADGRVYLTTSIGIVPSILQRAKNVFIEINDRQHPRLREMTDVYLVEDVPGRAPIDIRKPLDRIGRDHALVHPAKIAGIIRTSRHDKTIPFTPVDEVSRTIAARVVDFLLGEISLGHLPADVPPIQAGVGNIGNAIMSGFAENPDFPNFTMYSEVFQDSLVDLLLKERLTGISAASLALSTEKQQFIFDNMDFFVPRVVLRPSEISNNPEVIRRIGVISLNTAIEADIYGNVNATHFNGTTVMNGIGGSGDYAQNSRLSIFMTPSIRKDGKISSIVPMTPHVDHNEHSVHVIVTEQGVADLRGLDPEKRAMRIIDNCAHPMYREYLRDYIRRSGTGHIPHDLRRCFELYINFFEHGSMLPG